MKKNTLSLVWLVPTVVVIMFLMIAVLSMTIQQTDYLTDSLKADVLSSFPDVSFDSEEYDAINYLQREKIFRGNQDGTFNPNGTLNRAEWATILVRLSGANPSLENYNNCFPDVRDEWFAPSICFAKTQGWITGYAAGELAGKYGPQIPVKDIEAIATLARLTGWDIDDGGEWYEPALRFAQNKKLYNENKPVRDVKRKEIADITFKMLASVALGYDEFNDNLKNNIDRYGVYELTSVEIEDYEDEYEDDYEEYVKKKREQNWKKYQEGMCRAEVEIYGPIVEAFRELGIDVSDTNKKFQVNEPPHYDGYEDQDDTTIECEETGRVIIRLGNDFSVLPTYDEQKRRYEDLGKKQQGNFYYLDFTVFTKCINEDECVCWSTLELVNLETGEIEAMVESDQETCGNLKSNFSAMLRSIQSHIGNKFQNEDPSWGEPDPSNEPDPEDDPGPTPASDDDDDDDDTGSGTGSGGDTGGTTPEEEEDDDPEEIYYKFTCEVTTDPSGDYLTYRMDTSYEPMDKNGVNYYFEFGNDVDNGGDNYTWQDCASTNDMVPRCKDPRNGNPTESNLNFTTQYVIATYGSAASASQAAVSDYNTMRSYVRACTEDEI